MRFLQKLETIDLPITRYTLTLKLSINSSFFFFFLISNYKLRKIILKSFPKFQLHSQVGLQRKFDILFHNNSYSGDEALGSDIRRANGNGFSLERINIDHDFVKFCICLPTSASSTSRSGIR